jgi:hypothetical protein
VRRHRIANQGVAPGNPALPRLEALDEPRPLFAIELPEDPIEAGEIRRIAQGSLRPSQR